MPFETEPISYKSSEISNKRKAELIVDQPVKGKRGRPRKIRNESLRQCKHHHSPFRHILGHFLA